MPKKFDIQKIQNHDPGWEEEWGRIAEALLIKKGYKPKDNEDDLCLTGPLGRVCKNALENDGWRTEEFVFFVFDQYCKRVERQTLFLNFDEEKGDPIAFLCSYSYVSAYLKKFRSERVKIVWADDDSNDDEEISGIEGMKDVKALSPEQDLMQAKMTELFDSLHQAIVINCPKFGSRLYEMAGLQLYDKLSKTHEQMVRLHDDTRHEIAEIHETSETEADSKILERHVRDSQVIEEKIFELNLSLKANHYRTVESREIDSQKVISLSQKYIFAPLLTPSLKTLLKMPADNVARCLSRYLEKLPELCESYQKIYDEITLTGGETEDE
ncbi:MAG: hypothetical protein ACI4UF_06730 [Thermoguttaceae bacterium]